jgi:hypothetical protein
VKRYNPILKAVTIFAALACVSGCATTASPVIATTISIFKSEKTSIQNTPLRPEFSYLKVTRGQRAALMVLGEIDSHPSGPIEVWFSAEREVLRIQNGRIVGTNGMSVNWIHVKTIPNEKGYTRILDLMPGYQIGVISNMIQENITAPPAFILRQLDAIPAQVLSNLTWVKEYESGSPKAPAAYIGFENKSDRLIGRAGYQCLAADFCLLWQRL